jgi:F0F1-type ATP synthase assembly protein I
MSDMQWLKSLSLIFFGQLVIIGLCSLFFYYTKDELSVVSFSLGGLVYCIPALFAGLFMSRASNRSAALVVFKAYLGTLYKLIITVCLFVYVFKNIPINISVFLIAYAVAYVTQCIMSYVLHKK